MKLPEKTQKELEKKGKPKSPLVRGGGAAGRLHQFEMERGLDETDTGNAAADESAEKKNKKADRSDKRR